MAGSRNKIGELRIQKETTYLGSGTGSIMYLAIQDLPGIENFVRELHGDESVRQSIFDHGDAPKVGLKDGAFSLVCNFSAAGSDGISGNLTADNFHSLLKSAFGASSNSSGSTSTGASAVDSVDVVAGEGDNFNTGSFIMLDNEVRIIENISTDELSVTPDLSTAPSSGTVVYGSMSYYTDDTADRDTYIVEYHTETQKISVKARGCELLPTFGSLGAGEGPAMLTLEAISGTYGEQDSSIANTADTATNKGPVQSQGNFILSDGTTDLDLKPSSFELVPPLGSARFPDGSAENSKGQPRLIFTEGTITSTILQEDDENDPINQFRTWMEAGTELSVLYQVGNQPGDTIAFYCPYVFINSEPVPTEVDGLLGVEVNLKISEDRAATQLTKALYIGRL
jgi:hypothetical protein